MFIERTVFLIPAQKKGTRKMLIFFTPAPTPSLMVEYRLIFVCSQVNAARRQTFVSITADGKERKCRNPPTPSAQPPRNSSPKAHFLVY